MEENDLKKIKEYLYSPAMRRQLKIYDINYNFNFLLIINFFFKIIVFLLIFIFSIIYLHNK